jgi:hypothetical protein
VVFDGPSREAAVASAEAFWSMETAKIEARATRVAANLARARAVRKSGSRHAKD